MPQPGVRGMEGARESPRPVIVPAHLYGSVDGSPELVGGFMRGWLWGG